MKKSRKISLVRLRRLLDAILMESFFKRHYRRYFKGARGFHFLGIKKIRRFIGGRSISASYFLKVKIGHRQEIKIVNGRARQRLSTDENNPYRQFVVLKYLYAHGFKKYIPRPLDYLPSYNLLLYEHVEGVPLQQKLAQKEIKKVLAFIPQIVTWLKKLHQVKLKDKRLLLRDRKVEVRETRHALYLVRKYYPQGLPAFRKIIKNLNFLRWKNRNLFLKEKRDFSLCHYDVHFGNFLANDSRLKVIDFGDACLCDPLADLACFLVQTETMFDYYLGGQALKVLEKVRREILNLYFRRAMNKNEIFRLKYFEIRRLASMVANLVFVEGKEEVKKKMMSDFKKRAYLRLREIQTL